MTLKEALALVEAGGKVTCPYFTQKQLLALVDGQVKVVFQGSGTSYTFTPWPDFERDDWVTVGGWASYG